VSRRLPPLAFALAALLAPAAALACPVCSPSTEQNRLAFLGTTALLSFLPLGMIGGGVWWLRRHAGRFAAEEFTDRDAGLPADDPPARGPRPR